MAMTSTKPIMNTYNANRDWSPAQTRAGSDLAEICAPYWVQAQRTGPDGRPTGAPIMVLDVANPTLAAKLEQGSYAFDSLGQAFKDGELIQSPSAPANPNARVGYAL